MELEDISNSFEEDSDLLEFDDGVSSDCQEFNERRESLESTLGSRITQEEEELIYPILSISPKNLMTVIFFIFFLNRIYIFFRVLIKLDNLFKLFLREFFAIKFQFFVGVGKKSNINYLLNICILVKNL